MVTAGKTTTGGCMCGGVRYEATGEPRAVGHCHCP
ncbi:MAG: GFA family protein, partial [Alphaproteobacteria bacterium]